MLNPHTPRASHTQATSKRLETLLSAHAVSLPAPETASDTSRVSAAAALSEVYPQRAVEKALDYVQLVRRQLAGRPAAYDQFFKALKLYEEGRVELVDVLLRLMIMCAEFPKLLQALNYFLPLGYSFNLSMSTRGIELKTPTGTLAQPFGAQPFVP
ncbi:hypothetical protein BV20DRAFT_1051731 [Pilatotrama ljubarskyi]|nr:hypothetical protein BV20DRAFT_1051731 [Pilatotrama ljubarskyi]